MMKTSPNTLRIGIAVVVILGTIGWLAYTGYGSSKSYFVKVPELLSMGNVAYTRNLRVDGFVKPGSIERDGPRVDFVLNEYESHMPNAASGRTLKVSYKGSEPPPDTFKDDSKPWPTAPTAATASSTPAHSRPSAPASMRLPSRARSPPLPPGAGQGGQRDACAPPQRNLPQTDRMNANAPGAESHDASAPGSIKCLEALRQLCRAAPSLGGV